MKISGIVPAYNEEKTIENVLKVLRSSPLIDEIIVVSDGSSDKTICIVKNFFPKIKLISLSKNRGKANALIIGSKAAKNQILFFCDADLTNLKTSHIKILVKPVVEKKVRMVIGVQEYMNPFRDKLWYRKMFPNKNYSIKMSKNNKINEFILGLGGEKVLFKSDFLKIDKIKDSGYGIEHKIINYFKERKLPFNYKILKGVGHLHKAEKWGVVKGSLIDLKSYLIFIKQYLKNLLK